MSTLEGHVLGQTKESPGVLMRLDRLELLLKLVALIGGMSVAWKVLDIFGSFIASQALKQP